MKKNQKKTVVGTLELTYEGYGFVIPDKKGVPDVFVPAHAIRDALHRDKVEVTVEKGRFGKAEGRIVGIIEHGVKQLVGRFELRGKSGIVVTDDLRVGKLVIIPPGMEKGARHNEMVVVKIVEYPSGDRPIKGEVTERLGTRGKDETEISILIAKHNLPVKFSDGVLAEAGGVAESFDAGADGKRMDLTHVPFVTIDGESAKDFDDAVAAEKTGNQAVRVWVSIADVSHFVRLGSKLDHEALTRGTSVYLPGRCIPMLPEDLSNGICSLNPGVERFCFTAEMLIEPDGRVSESKFYRSVIKSRYRMTYTEANAYLTQGEKIDTEENVLKSLTLLSMAAKFIRRQRVERGSIDFDLPEPEIILDLTGKPENIVKAERNSAHLLIEDLMIAANESVATYLTRHGYPCVYRVHDRPDTEKLHELKVLLKNLGHNVKIGNDPSPKKMAKVVKCVAGRPEERLINMMLLRSMAQAVYDTQNIGHFGLASNCYCHFTSPIRRYPDLIVHRLLADAVCNHSRPGERKKFRNLKDQALHLSKLERRSMEAERESISLYSAVFMRDKIGTVFDGLISHVAKKGVFVELTDFFVEGMIKPEDLVGDRYAFDKRHFSYVGRKTGKSMRIGNRIKVSVKDVSIEERRIFFEPVAEITYKK